MNSIRPAFFAATGDESEVDRFAVGYWEHDWDRKREENTICLMVCR